jgi:Ca2+-binding EF-hand superfamily protein
MYAQLSASIEKVFCCLDTDGNGFLDRDELKAGFAAMVYSRPDIRIMLFPHTEHTAHNVHIS